MSTRKDIQSDLTPKHRHIVHNLALKDGRLFRINLNPFTAGSEASLLYDTANQYRRWKTRAEVELTNAVLGPELIVDALIDPPETPPTT